MSNLKYIIILIIVLVVIGAGTYFYVDKKKNNRSFDTPEDALSEVNTKKLSYSKSWYSQTSDSIQTNLMIVYRSSDAVKSVVNNILKLKNKDDWNYLVYKFGLRSGFSMSSVWKESLNKWLLYFLENRTYTAKSGTSGNALDLVQFSLNKIGVQL